MNKELYRLKTLVRNLENDIVRNNEENIVESINNIRKVCDAIENHVSFEKVDYEIINRISFLRFPFNYKKQESTNYLEFFSNKRLNDLKSTNALSEHNKFWSKHETVSGNVYGSLPKELIGKKICSSLEDLGWIEVDVEIIEFNRKIDDIRELQKYCNRYFNKYILIKEKETSSYLVLNYLF